MVPLPFSSPSAVTQAAVDARGSGIPSTLWLVPVHPSTEQAVCPQGFKGSISFGCKEVRLCLSMDGVKPCLGWDTMIQSCPCCKPPHLDHPACACPRAAPGCWHVLALPASVSPPCPQGSRLVVTPYPMGKMASSRPTFLLASVLL